MATVSHLTDAGGTERRLLAQVGGWVAKSPSSIPGLKKLGKKILIWQGHRRSLSLDLEEQSRLHSPKNTTWKYSVEKGFCGQICLGNTIDQHTYTHPISGLFIVSLLKALQSLAINKHKFLFWFNLTFPIFI